MKTKDKTEILTRILRLTERPGSIRSFFIALLFPEFAGICGELADLSRIVEKEEGKLP